MECALERALEGALGWRWGPRVGRERNRALSLCHQWSASAQPSRRNATLWSYKYVLLSPS